jgi:hypothetical protein
MFKEILLEIFKATLEDIHLDRINSGDADEACVKMKDVS